MKNAVGVAKRNATQELVQKAFQDRGLEATIAYIKAVSYTHLTLPTTPYV